MCIIAYKPKGAVLPDKTVLAHCFCDNPDGAGYMYVRNGAVEVRKGLMTFSAFWSAFSAQRFTKQDIVILHFRQATHGEISAQYTHPFPVSTSRKALFALSCKVPLAMAHNGVFCVPMAETETLSDTMVFVRDVLAPLWSRRRDNAIDTAIHTAIGENRVIVLEGDGTVHRYGHWIHDTDTGVLWSNNQYRRSTTRPWRSTFAGTSVWARDRHVTYDVCPMCGSLVPEDSIATHSGLI